VRSAHRLAAAFIATAAAALVFMAWLVRQPTSAVEKVDRRASRAERVEAALARSVRHRSWRVGEHELLLVEAPAQDGIGVVLRQCFVWRDAEFRSASLSCSNVENDLALSQD
jgi:hypothetical protein